MKQQKGFTLVEMAIVLVIIGLLLGGVLKGQELIDNSRIKNAINDMKGISAAYNGYLDRFQRLPGDDGPLATLTARGGAWTGTTAEGNNNGVLNIAANATFAGTGVDAAFFAHLRSAGFLSGNPLLTGVDSLPRNAFGGLTGVTGDAIFGWPAGRYVCMGSVPGKAARAIDASLDDGLPNIGVVRAIVGATNNNPTAAVPPITAYSDNSLYTICTSL